MGIYNKYSDENIVVVYTIRKGVDQMVSQATSSLIYLPTNFIA